jgi:hypothetical protein
MGYKDLTGQRFGRLTVLELAYIRDYRSHWLCKCDCGNDCVINSHNLGKHTNSCGCIAMERIKKLNAKHLERNTRLYTIWCNMKSRINNPNNPFYDNYGGRGITICNDWNDFISFKDWAVSSGYNDNLTIDRIDNNGNYEPLNCRWADRKEQSVNRRSTKFVTHNGLTLTYKEWSLRLGNNSKLVSNRVKKNGWNELAAVSTPVIIQGGKTS